MKTEREIRTEYEVVRGLADSAPRNSRAEVEWLHRAKTLAWVLGDDVDE